MVFIIQGPSKPSLRSLGRILSPKLISRSCCAGAELLRYPASRGHTDHIDIRGRTTACLLVSVPYRQFDSPCCVPALPTASVPPPTYHSSFGHVFPSLLARLLLEPCTWSAQCMLCLRGHNDSSGGSHDPALPVTARLCLSPSPVACRPPCPLCTTLATFLQVCPTWSVSFGVTRVDLGGGIRVYSLPYSPQESYHWLPAGTQFLFLIPVSRLPRVSLPARDIGAPPDYPNPFRVHRRLSHPAG